MRVLVLVPRIDYVDHLFEAWRDIWPDGVYRLRPKPVISIGPSAEITVHFAELNEFELRGTQWEVIDTREIEPLSDRSAGYLSYLQGRAQQLLGSGQQEHVMPLEIAWHLALVNGLQCDWGGCGNDARAARYSKDTHEWLPVCLMHTVRPLSVAGHPAAAAE